MSKYWKPTQAILDLNGEDLVGKKLIFEAEFYREIVVVAGADPMIGISLVKESDTSSMVSCLHGPLSPEVRLNYVKNIHIDGISIREYYTLVYPVFLKQLREAVKSGTFNDDEQDRRIGVALGKPATSSFGNECPYGV